MAKAEIGVFGGSGFYKFLEVIEEVEVQTPFGSPSEKITICEYKGRRIAFMPRHGKKHSIPPQLINYRANLWAFKEIGVKKIIGPCAAGSLDVNYKPGDFAICDQFVHFTHSRKDTFFDGNDVQHPVVAEPYCHNLRKIAIEESKNLGIPTHENGTVVVVQGPRFSTKAESAFYSKQGWQVINMTQYPENVLARELKMCYANIALITDYDSGVNTGTKPVTMEEVVKVFNENNSKLQKLLLEMIPKINSKECSCWKD